MRVVALDVERGAVDGDAPLDVGEEQQGVEASWRRGDERVAAAAPDEETRRELGDLTFDDAPLGVHAFHAERLSSSEEARESLIFGGDVEELPMKVLGKPGESRLQPGVVVGADVSGAHRPRLIHRPEAHRIGLVAGPLHQLLLVLDVRQRMELATVALDGLRPLALRVVFEAWPSEGARPAHRHGGEGHRSARSGRLPEAIADHVELLLDRPELHDDVGRWSWIAAQDVRVARYQELASALGHRQIERQLWPQRLLR
jgi:hypothetical protein